MNAHGRELRLICQRDLMEALERLPVPTFGFDIATLRFVAWNRRFEELLGYSRNEMLSMTAEEIRPQTEWETFRATLAFPQSHGFMAARYVRKDGEWLKTRLHYHHLECLNDVGMRTVVRIVVVEFWDDVPVRHGAETGTFI